MSNRREDSAGWAGRLVDDLAERFGAANVLQDIHSIKPGVKFVDAINETLQKSDCTLVVIGPAWLSLTDEAGGRRLDDAGDYVRLEVATAQGRGSPVVPVNRHLLEPTGNKPPAEAETRYYAQLRPAAMAA